ncbi:uncharacterized protein CTRU02_210660 [Colletotrichum truncatum]|uniref:Uncharacterized protein n=1 Tax=Colletotrichum truncatum TaxID=5467 RepID=A0ACC3YQV9_COLTU|nr:uncharacterized protein CTRU02_03846 [Colletotrichum truncatum]KAF6796868.1 hypothetical protein CTRU02_03846 [Colletotrichum truncatum]
MSTLDTYAVGQQQAEAPPSVGLLSRQAKRLFWTLQGPLDSSVFVMPESLDPDAPREAYFQQTDTGTSCHPVSKEALTDSKPASITVQSSELGDWASSWWELHYEHDDQADDDDDDDQSASGPQRCSGCGEIGPRDYEPLVVRASEKSYVTVHDFVKAVHPWLMAQRDEILQARSVGKETTPATDTKLVVMATQPEYVSTMEEESWHSDRRWALDEAYRYEGPLGQYGLGTKPGAVGVQDEGPRGTKRARRD